MKLAALKRKSVLETLGWIVATWFGAGCAPKAPGTVGSLFSLPLALVGAYYGTPAAIKLIVVLFLIGWGATHIVLRSQKELDPGFVVIDETVGQTITFVLIGSAAASGLMLVLGFILFRFFDIIKLWPASYFDRFVHNAFGVMMDDVIAGMYAGLMLYGLTFII